MNLKALKEAAERAGGDAWDLVAATEHHGPYVVGPVGDICDFYTMFNPSLPSTRNGGQSHPVPFYYADENAAFVALANPSTILELIESHAALRDVVANLHTALTEDFSLINGGDSDDVAWFVERARTALSTITKE